MLAHFAAEPIDFMDAIAGVAMDSETEDMPMPALAPFCPIDVTNRANTTKTPHNASRNTDAGITFMRYFISAFLYGAIMQALSLKNMLPSLQ